MASSIVKAVSERKYPFLASLFLVLFLVSLFTNSTNPLSSFSYSSSSQSQSITNPNPNPIPIEIPNEESQEEDQQQQQQIQSERPREEEEEDVDVEDEGVLEIRWEKCRMVDYIPCLDNWKAIKELRSRRHMEHRERHCPHPAPRCLVPVPRGYKAPVPWPRSRDMVRSLTLLR